MTLVTKEHIEEFIPQKKPFVMIDEIIACTETEITTSFLVQATNLFIENEKLREPALIENMAQTGAAQAGYAAKENGENPKIGYIGSIKNLKINQLPTVGDVLTTTLTHENDFGDFSIVQASIKVNEILVASCHLTIFLTQLSA